MRIPIGTQNVTLYCICWRTNVAVGPIYWFINGTRVTRTTASGNNPYSRDNVPAPLIIPSFTATHVGTYTCTSDNTAHTVDTATTDLALPGMCNYNSLTTYIIVIPLCLYSVRLGLYLLLEINDLEFLLQSIPVNWQITFWKAPFP